MFVTCEVPSGTFSGAMVDSEGARLPASRGDVADVALVVEVVEVLEKGFVDAGVLEDVRPEVLYAWEMPVVCGCPPTTPGAVDPAPADRGMALV